MTDIDELRGLLARAQEPRPAPLPEQDSRVGEAMAGIEDNRNRAQWAARRDCARNELVNALPDLLDELAALREREKALVAGLRQIMELPGEINPSNYDEDDVIALNNSHCEAYQIARTLIGDQS